MTTTMTDDDYRKYSIWIVLMKFQSCARSQKLQIKRCWRKRIDRMTKRMCATTERLVLLLLSSTFSLNRFELSTSSAAVSSYHWNLSRTQTDFRAVFLSNVQIGLLERTYRHSFTHTHSSHPLCPTHIDYCIACVRVRVCVMCMRISTEFCF